MKSKTLGWVIGIWYAVLLTGLCIHAVGTTPATPMEPYQWTLPLTMLLIIMFPFVAGYMAGSD